MPLRRRGGKFESAEIAILDSLSEVPQAISQRELASRAGFSVGLINVIIRKLIKTGYVKTSRLNRRSIQYLLTPQGFIEKALKSYRSMLSTVRSYHAMRHCCHSLLQQLCKEGISTFYLCGEGEMADLILTFFHEGRYGQIACGVPTKAEQRAVVLNVAPLPVKSPPVRVVEVFHEFAKITGSQLEGVSGGR